MTLTAADLRLARALIEDERHWCQGAYARDQEGQVVVFTSSRAVQWCAIGAVAKVANIRYPLIACDRIDCLGTVEFSLGYLNDVYGHAAALAELDRLTDLLEARERQEAGA